MEGKKEITIKCTIRSGRNHKYDYIKKDIVKKV